MMMIPRVLCCASHEKPSIHRSIDKHTKRTGGEDGDGLLGHVHAGKDGGRLRNARQPLGEELCK